MRSFEYTIKDEQGIHARPAGLLAKAAKAIEGEVTVGKNGKSVSASKLMAVMGLGIKCGDTVTVCVNGGDEEAAEKKLREFFETNL
ncbi:MAG: HPr family phosphocarrier protein [Oscillospiraceae bacterium]|nr:HPr family phosphocarrier protein [Oscillospiraceae bacterium]